MDKEVRKGEELDAANLYEALKGFLPGMDGVPEITQFRGGFSNLTYQLKCGDKKWVLRRPPFGSRGGSAHNMMREFRVLQILEKTTIPAPKPIHLEENEDVIGAPFFIMEKLDGVIVRAGATETMGYAVNPEAFYLSLGEAAIDMMAELHKASIPVDKMLSASDPETYTQRQLEGWIRRFGNALTDDIPEPVDVYVWLMEHQPKQKLVTFLHNDFKFDNLVLDPVEMPVRIRGILDWEMASWGDPLADLGTTLAYWTEAGDNPLLQMFGATSRPGNLTRDEVIERYAAKTGFDVSDMGWHHKMGMFKVAGIVQQIYFRYKKGATSDKRFAGLKPVIEVVLGQIREGM